MRIYEFMIMTMRRVAMHIEFYENTSQALRISTKSHNKRQGNRATLQDLKCEQDLLCCIIGKIA